MRQYVLPMSADLEPGETKEISVESTCVFRADRLCIAAPPQPAWRHAISLIRHFPRALRLNLFALGKEIADLAIYCAVNASRKCRGVSARRPLMRHLGWAKRPGWKPLPYIPIIVLNFKVGARDQFRGEIPSELFHFNDERGVFDANFESAELGSKITLVIRSTASKPFTFRAAVVGTVFI